MDHQPAAPLPRRIGSLCYEALLLGAVLFAGGSALLLVTHALNLNVARPVLQLHLVAVAGIYLVYCWTHGGQTLPMKTWRIRLLSQSGEPVTLATSVRRYLFALVGLSLCGVTLLWAFCDRDRQFLHDRLARTRIVSL